jgi:hypothetical protein
MLLAKINYKGSIKVVFDKLLAVTNNVKIGYAKNNTQPK